MKERFSSIIAVVLLTGLVGVTWWAADYAQRSVQTDPAPRVTHEMDAWSRNFVMLRTDPQGRLNNRLDGDYFEHFPDDDSYHITEPRAVGQQIGNPITIGTSRTAVMEQRGKRIVMNTDAHIHRVPDANNDALDVRSQQLIILPDDDVVYTDIPADVLKGNSRMSGKGMHYNNKTRQLQVSSSTDVEIAPSESRKRATAYAQTSAPAEEPSTLILSDILNYDDLKKQSIFTGSVVLTRGLMTLHADRLDVREDAASNQFGNATANKSRVVTIRQERPETFELIEGTGLRAEYNSSTSEFDLIGQAIVIRHVCGKPFDTIRGERIRYNDKIGTYHAQGSANSAAAGGRVRSFAESRAKVDAVIPECRKAKQAPKQR